MHMISFSTSRKEMKSFLIAAAAILCCFQQTAVADQLDDDARQLSLNLNQFIEQSLLPIHIRNHMDQYEINQKEGNGKEILDTMVTVFQKKYLETLFALDELRSAVQTSHKVNWWSPFANLLGNWFGGRPSCCVPSTNSYSSSLELPAKGCELWSKTSPLGAARLTEDFEKSSINISRKYPWLKRQYFGSVGGVTTVYPPLTNQICSKFECNKRSWYVQAKNNQPKQVVLIFDNTPSLYDSYWEWYSKSLTSLQKVAKSYISSLNTYDMVDILLVSSSHGNDSVGQRGFFHHDLVHATFQNKIEMTTFIENIQATGVGDFLGTFMKAMTLAEKVTFSGPGYHKRKEVILITIGSPVNHIPFKDLKEILKSKNQYLVDPIKVRIRAKKGSEIILNDYLDSNKKSEDKNDVSTNLSTSLKNIDNNDGRAVWSFPYLDSWNLGQVVTTSSPVFQNGHLIGVVAVDTTLNEFFEEPNSIKFNKLSYTFLVDDAGHVLNHPMLTTQSDVDMNMVDITSLERGEQFRSVVASMKRGESGKKTIFSERLLSTGNHHGYPVTETLITKTYFWKRVPSTRYSIGVALIAENVIDLKPGSRLPEDAFLFHRFDLSPPPTPCSHFNTFASMNKPSVFLTSLAFQKKIDDERLFQDFQDVNKLTDSINSKTENIFQLRDGIKEDIIATNFIQKLWTDKLNIYQSNILWRHFTTPSGVFQIFPGIQIPQFFDPTAREWYQQSMAFKESGVIISTPYMDPASHKMVVTLAQALHQTSRSYFDWRVDQTPMLGVSGVDVRLDYFYRMFLEWFPSCQKLIQRCYLLDGAGFLIVTNIANHTNPHVNAAHENHIIKYHMTQIEPEISSLLTEKRFLKELNCSAFSSGCSRRTYEINNRLRIIKETFQVGEETIDFRLVAVKGTNSYLLIRTVDFISRKQDSCFCSKQKCAHEDSWLCERQIYNENPEKLFCQGSYLDSYLTSLPCLRPEYMGKIQMFDKRAPSALPQCYDTTFKVVELQSLPLSLPTLLWIVVIAASILLSKQYLRLLFRIVKLPFTILKYFYSVLFQKKNSKKSEITIKNENNNKESNSSEEEDAISIIGEEIHGDVLKSKSTAGMKTEIPENQYEAHKIITESSSSKLLGESQSNNDSIKTTSKDSLIANVSQNVKAQQISAAIIQKHTIIPANEIGKVNTFNKQKSEAHDSKEQPLESSSSNGGKVQFYIKTLEEPKSYTNQEILSRNNQLRDEEEMEKICRVIDLITKDEINYMMNVGLNVVAREQVAKLKPSTKVAAEAKFNKEVKHFMKEARESDSHIDEIKEWKSIKEVKQDESMKRIDDKKEKGENELDVSLVENEKLHMTKTAKTESTEDKSNSMKSENAKVNQLPQSMMNEAEKMGKEQGKVYELERKFDQLVAEIDFNDHFNLLDTNVSASELYVGSSELEDLETSTEINPTSSSSDVKASSPMKTIGLKGESSKSRKEEEKSEISNCQDTSLANANDKTDTATKNDVSTSNNTMNKTKPTKSNIPLPKRRRSSKLPLPVMNKSKSQTAVPSFNKKESKPTLNNNKHDLKCDINKKNSSTTSLTTTNVSQSSAMPKKINKAVTKQPEPKKTFLKKPIKKRSSTANLYNDKTKDLLKNRSHPQLPLPSKSTGSINYRATDQSMKRVEKSPEKFMTKQEKALITDEKAKVGQEQSSNKETEKYGILMKQSQLYTPLPALFTIEEDEESFIEASVVKKLKEEKPKEPTRKRLPLPSQSKGNYDYIDQLKNTYNKKSKTRIKKPSKGPESNGNSKLKLNKQCIGKKSEQFSKKNQNHHQSTSKSVEHVDSIKEVNKKNKISKEKNCLNKQEQKPYLRKDLNSSETKDIGNDNNKTTQKHSKDAKDRPSTSIATSAITASRHPSDYDALRYNFPPKKGSPRKCSCKMLKESMKSLTHTEQNLGCSLLNNEELIEFDHFSKGPTSKRVLSATSLQSVLKKDDKDLKSAIDDEEMQELQELQKFLYWESVFLNSDDGSNVDAVADKENENLSSNQFASASTESETLKLIETDKADQKGKPRVQPQKLDDDCDHLPNDIETLSPNADARPIELQSTSPEESTSSTADSIIKTKLERLSQDVDSHYCFCQLLKRSMNSLTTEERILGSSLLTEDEQKEFDEFYNNPSTSCCASSSSNPMIANKESDVKKPEHSVDEQDLLDLQEIICMEKDSLSDKRDENRIVVEVEKAAGKISNKSDFKQDTDELSSKHKSFRELQKLFSEKDHLRGTRDKLNTNNVKMKNDEYSSKDKAVSDSNGTKV